MRKVQFSITIGALAVALVHIIWPDLGIDSVTIGLLVLAAVPWLVPLFKSLEFPGGWKVEFQDLEKTTEEAEIAGLLDSKVEAEPSIDSPYKLIASQDSKLVLADLRIKIERRLDRLAAAGGLDLKPRGSGYLLHTLARHDLLTSGQKSVLAEITGMLNANIHAPEVDYLAVKWAIDTGPSLLMGMDRQIEKISQNNR